MRTSVNYYCKRWWYVWLGCVITVKHKSVAYLLQTEWKWSEVAQSCPTPCDPMDCNLPGSSICGILQARILEWVAISFSRRSSQPRDQTQVSCITGRRFTIWATRDYRQSMFDAWYWMLGAGALGWPRGMVWGGMREGGSGWGTRVYLWWIHVDIWQNQYNIVKLKNKIIKKKKKNRKPSVSVVLPLPQISPGDSSSLHCLRQPWLPWNRLIRGLSESSPNLAAPINTNMLLSLPFRHCFLLIDDGWLFGSLLMFQGHGCHLCSQEPGWVTDQACSTALTDWDRDTLFSVWGSYSCPEYQLHWYP